MLPTADTVKATVQLQRAGKRIAYAREAYGDARGIAQIAAAVAADAGLSKSDIAATLGISRPTLDRWLDRSDRDAVEVLPAGSGEGRISSGKAA